MKFNEQYLVYEGRQTGTNVKQLLEYAVQNNQSLYKEEDTIKYCVCIRSNSKLILSKFTDGEMQRGLNGSRWYGVRYPDNIRKIKSAVSSSKIYMIEFKNNDLGYIWEIWINDAS